MTVEIAPDGGFVELRGHTLIVPEGALTSTVAITMTVEAELPVDLPEGYTAIGEAVQLSPEGTVLATPALLMLAPFAASSGR